MLSRTATNPEKDAAVGIQPALFFTQDLPLHEPMSCSERADTTITLENSTVDTTDSWMTHWRSSLYTHPRGNLFYWSKDMPPPFKEL